MSDTAALIRQASQSTIASLFADRVRAHPHRPAIQHGNEIRTFAELDDRARRLAGLLSSLGVGLGDRVAILSENRPEYVEAALACARIGAILACQNWRLAVPELQHCVDLVEPKAVLVSPRHRANLDAIGSINAEVLQFDEAFETALAGVSVDTRDGINSGIDAESGLLILYTSGTTGLPKGALISHRAEVARAAAARVDFQITPGEPMVIWLPMFHMAGMDYTLTILTGGGKVIIEDGFDAARLATILEREPVGWFIVLSGMIDALIGELRERAIEPVGVRLCGGMADLVPPAQIAEITTLLGAPFANTLGSTETGSMPAGHCVVPVGVAPEHLPKRQSPHCELRLLDTDGLDVPVGIPGELTFRGPTLFSGYWRADKTNAEDFRDGWFHNGDLLVRHGDGSFDFVDRVKYMIKSGGENIYPAEIERVLLSDPRVTEAAVVRRADDRWGEVPVAFVATSDDRLDAEALRTLCRASLAGFKQPKEIHFIDHAAFPRNATSKVLRHELQAMLPERD